MRQALHRLTITTRGQGLTDTTFPVRAWLTAEAAGTGLLTPWCRHTSASLIVQGNADPDVRCDLEAFFHRLVPEDSAHRRQDEGPDDMPAHIKATLTQTQPSIPVESGAPVLGTWRAIYLFEHRAAPHRREVVLHLLDEPVG